MKAAPSPAFSVARQYPKMAPITPGASALNLTSSSSRRWTCVGSSALGDCRGSGCVCNTIKSFVAEMNKRCGFLEFNAAGASWGRGFKEGDSARSFALPFRFDELVLVGAVAEV